MIVPFASGAQSRTADCTTSHPHRMSGGHIQHPSSAAGLRLTVTDRSADVLPERVRPKGEPTEEPAGEPTGKARRKGPRRRGR